MSHADCPQCAGMLRQSVAQNPLGYRMLAKAQPGAVFKLCPKCKKGSKVHGADSATLATVGGLPGADMTDEERHAMWKKHRMERIIEAAFISLIVIVSLTYLFPSKKRASS